MFRVRRLLAAPLLSLVVSLGLGGPMIAQAQQGGVGLVNVFIDDVLSRNNVTVNVAANVAAAVCGVTAQVGVIAEQIARTGAFECRGANNQEIRIQSAQRQ